MKRIFIQKAIIIYFIIVIICMFLDETAIPEAIKHKISIILPIPFLIILLYFFYTMVKYIVLKDNKK